MASPIPPIRNIDFGFVYIRTREAFCCGKALMTSLGAQNYKKKFNMKFVLILVRFG